jgi:cell division septal protein FtsQ
MPSKLQVNISDLQEIDLLADDTLRVRIGDANNLDKKIKLFETIFSRIKDKKDKIEYIDLRFPLFPVVKYK